MSWTPKKLDNVESMVTLAAVQMEPHLGEKDENVAKSIKLINEAADKGAKLITLPELCNTGYMFNSREEVYSCAEHVPGRYTCNEWERLLKSGTCILWRASPS